MRLLSLTLLLGVLIGGLPVSGGAQVPVGATEVVESTAEALDRWDAEAALIEQVLEEQAPDSNAVDGMRATLEAQLEEIPATITASEAERALLSDQLEALGPAPEDPATEAHEIAAERAKLAERIAEAEALLKKLGQADARAVALLSRLTELRRQLFTEELMTRGPSVFEPGAVGRAVSSIAGVVSVIYGETAEQIAASRMDTRFLVRMLSPLVLIAAALLLLSKLKRAALRWLVPVGTSEEAPGEAAAHRPNLLIAVGVTLVRLLMPAAAVAMIVAVIWNSNMLGPQGETLVGGLVRTAMAVIAAYALGASFYAPHMPQFRLSKLLQEDAKAAHRWIMVLAAVVGLGLVLVEQGRRLGLSLEGLELVNTVLLLGGGVALWAFAGYLVAPERRPVAAVPENEDEAAAEPAELAIGPVLLAAARIIARAVALFAPALALMGYFAASRFLFHPLVFSTAAIGVCVLLFSRVHDAVHRLTAPEAGADKAAAPSRAQLIPVLLGLLLICALAPVLALIWGADVTDLSFVWRMISEGFEVGEVTIAPLDFFSFVLVFSVGYLLTRIVQGILARSVLPVTGLDAGGQGGGACRGRLCRYRSGLAGGDLGHRARSLQCRHRCRRALGWHRRGTEGRSCGRALYLVRSRSQGRRRA